MARTFRRILVAIRDPASVPRAMLRKAAALAAAADADVELFHAISQPLVSPARGRGRSPDEEMAAVAERMRARLERLARTMPPELEPRVHAEWDYPPHEAVIRRVLAVRADLVVAAPQPPGLRSRLLLANTDWELIRHCPCPLLLVKSGGGYERPVILAAVDPFHANAKPADLDGRLLRTAAELARLTQGEVHAFHAWLPLAATMGASLVQPAPVMVPSAVERERERTVRAAFDALAARAGVPTARRHLQIGEVTDALVSAVRTLRARIVVMGAVSRSGLRRIFIGSTAERALDRVPCDVLVVKPRGFEVSVPRRGSPLPGRSGR